LDSTPGTTSAVRALIDEHIRSVVELECLLLLQRDPARAWTSVELADELRIAADWALRELDDLTRRGFASANSNAPPRYAFAAPTPALRAAVAQLATYYAEHRVSVIEMIYARPPAGPLKNFADAFRIRKEPPRE
jgi:hypothetical protein